MNDTTPGVKRRDRVGGAMAFRLALALAVLAPPAAALDGVAVSGDLAYSVTTVDSTIDLLCLIGMGSGCTVVHSTTNDSDSRDPALLTTPYDELLGYTGLATTEAEQALSLQADGLDASGAARPVGGCDATETPPFLDLISEDSSGVSTLRVEFDVAETASYTLSARVTAATLGVGTTSGLLRLSEDGGAVLAERSFSLLGGAISDCQTMGQPCVSETLDLAGSLAPGRYVLEAESTATAACLLSPSLPGLVAQIATGSHFEVSLDLDPAASAVPALPPIGLAALAALLVAVSRWRLRRAAAQAGSVQGTARA